MIAPTQPHNTPVALRSEPMDMDMDMDAGSSDAGAYAALLRASESAQRLAQQTQTQWVVSAQSHAAELFGVERKS